MSEVDCPTKSDKENLKASMINKLVLTDAHFKHQQRGEPDLSQDERTKIALDILNKNPAVFLERFSQYLTLEDLSYFQDEKDDYQVGFYIREISQRFASSNRNVVKNRRFQAMQKLMDEGEYFSEDEMRWRDPLLYEQLIGQYTSEEEKKERAEKDIDKTDLKFSTILLKHMDMQANKQFYKELKEKEEEQEEEEEDSDEEEEEESIEAREGESNTRQDQTGSKSERGTGEADDISDLERNYFRGEFLRIMQEKFLSGEDNNFDYSKVDSNADYDSLDIAGHDAEEKYFDADDSSDNSCGFTVSVEDEKTSVEDEKTSVEDEKTSVMDEKTSMEDEKTSVEDEKTKWGSTDVEEKTEETSVGEHGGNTEDDAGCHMEEV